MDKLIVSPKGEKLLRENIAKEEARYREICAAKSDAYHNSGDGWHDNAAYEQLIAEERAAEVRITQLKGQLASLTIVNLPAVRKTDSVHVGAIVKLARHEKKSDVEDEVIWEIMPAGETDIKLNRVAYNAPLAAPLITLEPSDIATIRLKDKVFECEILELFPSREAAGLTPVKEEEIPTKDEDENRGM